MFTGRKLPITIAFIVLIGLAFGAGCKGFFVDPTLASFVISPTNPTVPLGGTTQMQAFGTNTDGSPAGNVTNKVTWSSKASGIISVSAAGVLKGVTLSPSTVEIDASFQALTGQSTTATVCVENGSNFKISPTNASVTSNNTVDFTESTDAPVGGVQTTVDITASAQWTSSNTAAVTITSGVNPAVATAGQVTQDTPVTITAVYTCNGTTNTTTTTLTAKP